MPGRAGGSAARCAPDNSSMRSRCRCDASWRVRRVSAGRPHSCWSCVVPIRPFAGMLDVLVIEQHPCLASGQSICRIRHDCAKAL